MPQHGVRPRVAGIKRHCSSKGRFRGWPIPRKKPARLAEGMLPLSEIGLRPDRMRSGFASVRPHVEGRCIAVKGSRGVSLREPGPGERIVAVDFNGASVVLHRPARGQRRELIPKPAASKVQIISISVSRVPSRERLETFRR